MAYWLWMPATVDLNDAKKRAELLRKNEVILRGCSHLSGVFVPGGDPGDNAPGALIPFLQETAKQLAAIHPNARVWFPLQGFSEPQVRWVFDYLRRQSPTWLGGLAGGPSSPPLPVLRGVAGAISAAPLPRHHPQQTVPVSGVLVGSCLCPDVGARRSTPGPYNTPQSTTGSHPTRTDLLAILMAPMTM